MLNAKNNMIYTKESHEIIGACIEVQRCLGVGFQEPVYQEALAIEFEQKGIPYEREKELVIYYKDTPLQKSYKADFVCCNKIIVELKTVNDLCGEHRSQVINYLKATKMKLGLLINFGQKPIGVERLINDL